MNSYTVHPHPNGGYTAVEHTETPGHASPHFDTLQDAYQWATNHSHHTPALHPTVWETPHDNHPALHALIDELAHLKRRLETLLTELTQLPTTRFDHMLAELDEDELETPNV